MKQIVTSGIDTRTPYLELLRQLKQLTVKCMHSSPQQAKADLERYLREVRALPDIGSVREPAGEWNPRSEGEARETEDNSDDNASMEDTESEEESKDTEGGGRYLRVQGELGPAGEWLLVAYHKPWQLLPPPFRNAFDDANEDQDESLLLDLQEHQSSLHGSSFNVA